MNKFLPLSLVAGRCEHLSQWTIAVICHTPWTIGRNSTVWGQGGDTARARLLWWGKMLWQIVWILPSHILPFQTVGSHDFGKILTICSQFCLPGKIIRSPQWDGKRGSGPSSSSHTAWSTFPGSAHTNGNASGVQIPAYPKSHSKIQSRGQVSGQNASYSHSPYHKSHFQNALILSASPPSMELNLFGLFQFLASY